MKKMILIVFLSLIPMFAQAADKWTKEQIELQVAATTLIVIDWGQTLDIAENPDEYSERNPFFDEHPDKSQVNKYIATALVGQLLISHFLPSKYRDWWLTGFVIVEAANVTRNFGIGLRIRF